MGEKEESSYFFETIMGKRMKSVDFGTSSYLCLRDLDEAIANQCREDWAVIGMVGGQGLGKGRCVTLK